MLFVLRSPMDRLPCCSILFSLALVVSATLAPMSLGAQEAERRRGAGPEHATLRVRVLQDTLPVRGALVRSGRVGGQTDADGRALLRLVPGPHSIVVARIGFVPDTLELTLAAGQDTSITVQLEERGAELESVVVDVGHDALRRKREPPNGARAASSAGCVRCFEAGAMEQ